MARQLVLMPAQELMFLTELAMMVQDQVMAADARGQFDPGDAELRSEVDDAIAAAMKALWSAGIKCEALALN